MIDTGANNVDEIYSKSKALQTWLVGYELTETIILMSQPLLRSATDRAPSKCPKCGDQVA